MKNLLKPLRALVATILLALTLIIPGTAQPASALSNWSSWYSQGFRTGNYIAYSYAGEYKSFAVRVQCTDGLWRTGPRIHATYTVSSATCPVGQTAGQVTGWFWYF